MEQGSQLHELVQGFRELKRTFHQVVSKQAEKMGITGIQFYVLAALREQPEMSMSDLAERVHLGNSTLSGVIDRMEKAGYVERKRSELDRRTVTLHLTDKGREIERQTNLLYQKAMGRISEIPQEEITQLIRTFRSIINLFETEKEGE
ncbi:MarR family winged helix-turn-helix transcriptional regulator [Paenibacillus physcomitrellae]|uniref:MarR family winged helix-turn-helix transcriptional regulator n=1 Tax=Paenibacillus physcomitrellae TaxID=1619311 RepID=UPI00157FB410|nr:MarR family transcriptional regulator [Paenibacillus physcomitrellae]